MDKTMKFIADPGHAWLKVLHRDVIEAGVADDISSCSYIDREFVYLEEDCDAPRFLAAVGKSAADIDEEEQPTTYIRELPPYTPAGLTTRGARVH